MKWKDIFNLGIEMGQDCDIRNIDKPGSYSRIYSDCSIIYGNGDSEINKIYAAVDAGVSELLLVNELNKRGSDIDGVLVHHPTAAGAYNLTGVVELQKFNWEKTGVDPRIADKIYESMIDDEAIELKEKNFLDVKSAAEFLGIPVMCMHTAIDNIVQVFFENFFIDKKLWRLKDVLREFNKIYECSQASAMGDEPYIIGDNIKSYTGRIMVDMTGGIDPDSKIFYYLKKAGINTLIAMHYSQDNVKSIRENKINAVITGHMAGDSIGLNKFCDRLEERGLEIVQGSGFYRYRRGKDKI
jgi:hypothetical protein